MTDDKPLLHRGRRMHGEPARRIIARCLGSFWIVDGLLQLQPLSFGPAFAKQVLAPNLAGQPDALRAIIAWGISLWDLNPVAFNTGVIVLQVGIGVLLWIRPSTRWFRIGAWGSILWGMTVWVFGTGAGPLLTGTATFYSGAPNAVLLYVILTILLLTGDRIQPERFVQTGAWLFILGAVLQLQPMFWTASGIVTSVTANGDPFALLNAWPAHISQALAHHPIAGNVVLVLLTLVIGIALLAFPTPATGYVALTFLALVWWWGQDFGGLTTVPTGTATDPSTAPLQALFLIPLLLRHAGRERDEPT